MKICCRRSVLLFHDRAYKYRAKTISGNHTKSSGKHLINKTQLVSKLLFLHWISWIVGRKITKYKYRKNHTRNYINMQSRERRLNRDTTVYLSLAPVRCHGFYRDEVLHSWKNWILCRIIRMILGRYLQNCRDRLVIAINQKPYHVCNLNIKDLV